MKRYLKQLTILTIIASAILFGCKKEEEDSQNLFANKELMSVMNAYYLWYDEMPSVSYADFSSPIELLDALTYKELDRWSYITTKQQLEAYYTAGEYIGFGIGLAFDSSDQLWITFIFEQSDRKSVV